MSELTFDGVALFFEESVNDGGKNPRYIIQVWRLFVLAGTWPRPFVHRQENAFYL